MIAVFDSSRALDSDDADVIATCAGRRGVAILNKSDLPPRLDVEQLRTRGLALPVVDLSALTGAGLAELRARLERVASELAGGDPATSVNTDPPDSSTWDMGDALKAAAAAQRPGRGADRDGQAVGGSDQAALPKSEIVAISRERHRDALAHALDSLAAARHSARSAMPPEIVAVDVMAAADALGSITGLVGTEDVLDALFREFCVGK